MNRKKDSEWKKVLAFNLIDQFLCEEIGLEEASCLDEYKM